MRGLLHTVGECGIRSQGEGVPEQRLSGGLGKQRELPFGMRADGMGERRTALRRGADRILREAVHFNRILLDILGGRPQPFLDYSLRIGEIRELLGRRQEDRQVADELADGLERIVRRLVEIGVIDKMPRKVRIRKVRGEEGGSFPEGTVREGWEKEAPQLGKRYCLYQDNGKIYRTGLVQTLSPTEFVTGYSTYRLEVLQEDVSESLA